MWLRWLKIPLSLKWADCKVPICNFHLIHCVFKREPNIPKEKHNLKRYMHPNVHCSTVYNSQDKEQPKCPSTEEWIKKVCYIHTMEYYLAIKKNEIMLFAATWMDLKIIILSEVRQTKERQISYNITYKWNLKKDTNELTYKIERESQTKKTNLWLPKETQEKDKLGVWYWNIHTTISKINNQQEPNI